MMESPQVSASQQGSKGDLKKTRNRVVTSCSECTRRKQKCNRQWPCNHCLSRRAVELCHYNITRPKTKLDFSINTPHLNKNQTKNSTESERSLGVASLEEEFADEIVLEEISHPEGTSHSVLGAIFYPEAPSQKQLFPSWTNLTSRTELLKLFPPRPVVDFLIQHFLAEVNWLYEEIYPPTFLERYNSWWSLLAYNNDSIQFGILILRLCVNSVQFLPHPSYPTDGLSQEPLDTLEARCNTAALELDKYQPRKPSLLRVQQLLIYIPTLSNAGKSEETYEALRDDLKEAQDINLFLEDKWYGLSEFEKEARRKTFWNLYVWDSTFFGRWPLIPDGYYTVRLPSETPYGMTAPIPGAPNIFTDVLLNIKICQFMHSSFSAPAKKAERLDPVADTAHFTTFQEEFIDKLPPAFRLDNPDTSWDDKVPNLRKKREFVHIGTLGVAESMHKGFVSAIRCKSLRASNHQAHRESASEHRTTLLNACIGILTSLNRLHVLMGGGAHRYFFLSVCCVEATTVLGLSLLSDSLASKAHSPSRDMHGMSPELRQRSYGAFSEGITLVNILSERSLVARKGLEVLRKLNARISAADTEALCQDAPISKESETSICGLVPVTQEPTNRAYTELQANDKGNQDDMIFKEWESFSASGDFAWFFEDSTFINPSDFGVDFGNSL